MSNITLNVILYISYIISEVVILLICYQLIYKKKNISNVSLLDFYKMLARYYIFIVKYKLHHTEKDCDFEKYLQENSKIRYQLFFFHVFGSMTLFVLPMILIFVTNLLLPIYHDFMTAFLPEPVFYLVVFISGISVFLTQLKEERIGLMEVLKQGQVFLVLFSRKKKSFICKSGIKKGRQCRKQSRKKEKKAFRKISAVKVLLIVLMFTCGDITLILMQKDLIEITKRRTVHFDGLFSFTPLFFLIVAAAIICYVVLCLMDEGTRNTVIQKINYKRKIRKQTDIIIWTAEGNTEELAGWMDEFLRMCACLEIKEVMVFIDETNQKSIFSMVPDTERPSICIGRRVFDKGRSLYQTDFYDIIKLIVAHELVHIHYKDTKWMRKIYFIALLYIVAAICTILAAGLRIHVIAGLVVAAPLIVLNSLVFKILWDERYWMQVLELRADRIGIGISNTSAEILEKALACTGEAFDYGQGKREFFYKQYQDHVEQQIHPYKETRIYEAKRMVPWQRKEYARYFWKIFWNKKQGKGWRI